MLFVMRGAYCIFDEQLFRQTQKTWVFHLDQHLEAEVKNYSNIDTYDSFNVLMQQKISSRTLVKYNWCDWKGITYARQWPQIFIRLDLERNDYEWNKTLCIYQVSFSRDIILHDGHQMAPPKRVLLNCQGTSRETYSGTLSASSVQRGQYDCTTQFLATYIYRYIKHER